MSAAPIFPAAFPRLASVSRGKGARHPFGQPPAALHEGSIPCVCRFQHTAVCVVASKLADRPSSVPPSRRAARST